MPGGRGPVARGPHPTEPEGRGRGGADRPHRLHVRPRGRHRHDRRLLAPAVRLVASTWSSASRRRRSRFTTGQTSQSVDWEARPRVAIMERFPLGPFEVSRVGFGAMQLPGRGVMGPPRDREQALAVLRRAVEAGVNHIDTAQYYGPDVSNELIREALHPYAEDLALVSKVGARRDEQGGWIPWDAPERAAAGDRGQPAQPADRSAGGGQPPADGGLGNPTRSSTTSSAR